MSCRSSALKVTLNILNTVLSLLGVALIALSIFELNASTAGTSEHIAIVVQIFIGSFVILTSFLGCFGACRESLNQTWSYATCVSILLAFQIYILIAAHTSDKVESVTNEFNSLWLNYTANAVQIAKIEQKFNCCGKFSSKDYILRGTAIPRNCYKDLERTASNLHTNGCLDAVRQYAIDKGDAGLAIKWTLFAIEICALGTAAFFGITLRNKQRRAQFGK